MASNKPDNILTEEEEDVLSSWIGKQCQFQLLYKMSRDGLSANTFHQLCDGKGPTVTILYNTIGNVFGGYLSQSWNSNNVQITDENAFLFKLRDENESYMTKFSIRVPAMAACGVREWGPTFGGRVTLDGFLSNQRNIPCFQQVLPNQSTQIFDLHTFSDSKKNFVLNQRQQHNQIRMHACLNGFALNGQEHLGNSYNGSSIEVDSWDSGSTLSGGDFNVIDLEVYLLKEWKNPAKNVSTDQP